MVAAVAGRAAVAAALGARALPAVAAEAASNPILRSLLRRSQDRLKQVMPGSAACPVRSWFLLAAIGVAVAGFYAFTFRVGPDELGVVMRFGEFVRPEPPGLHFRLPYPIEEVRLPKVTRKNTIEVGFRSSVVRRGSTGTTNVPEESGMLTGDENVVEVPFVVIWRIQDAEKYLFRIQNPESTVKDVAESAMREIVGKTDFERILTSELGAVRNSVQKLMQDTLDSYEFGHHHRRGELAARVPAGLGRRFLPRRSGGQDRSRNAQEPGPGLRQQDRARRPAVPPTGSLPRRKATRSRLSRKRSARRRASSRCSPSTQKAPEVTRQRLYLETMERVLGGADKIILDSKGGSGVVPYLPLDQLQRKPQGVK